MERVIFRHLTGSKAPEVDSYPLDQFASLLVGREPSSTLRYDPTRDDVVGRQHARIEKDAADPYRIVVTDLASRNGTLVNGRRIARSFELTPGDIVQFGIGGPELEFQLDPLPERFLKLTRAQAERQATRPTVAARPAAAPRPAATASNDISGWLPAAVAAQQARARSVPFLAVAGALLLALLALAGWFAEANGDAVDATPQAAAAAPRGARAGGPPARPPLVVRQGQYFRASMPAGWQWTENANAVEMVAPDGVTGSSASLVIGMFGQATPRGYLQQVLQSLGYADARVVSWQDLPPQPAFMNFVWQIGHAELAFTYRGQPVRAAATVGVIQGAGQYAAVVLAGQAPVASWDQARAWLLRVAHSVTITNPRQVAGVDRMVLPGNIPHDYIYGDYNDSWQARGIPEDRLSQARREGMMGYEEVVSPTTGERFEMPLETYDATVGGYRNPNQPREILFPRTWPGR
jgi:hypothetical protein